MPLYHVLAAVLLSAERMGNGLLYAVWAVPAARFFLGMGAVSYLPNIRMCEKQNGSCPPAIEKTVPYRNSGRGRFFCSPKEFIPGAGHTDVHFPECPAGSDGAS